MAAPGIRFPCGQEVVPMMYGWYGGGWLTMLALCVLMIIVMAAGLGLIAWLASTAGIGATARSAGPESSDRAVLDRRYAAGEVDTDTYRTMRAELSGKTVQ